MALAQNLKSILARTWQWFIDALWPRRCLGCGKLGNWSCPICLAGLNYPRQLSCPGCGEKTPLGEYCELCSTDRSLNGLWSTQPYSNPLIRNLIKSLKFEGLVELTPILVSLMVNLLKAFNLPPAWHGRAREQWLLTSVPLMRRRLRQRNFNQAELLALGLAQATGLAYLPTLQKIGGRRPQSEIKQEADRLTNVRGAFAVLPEARITGATFILVDDVFTSGATLEECARVLKSAGAIAVWGLVVAKG